MNSAQRNHLKRQIREMDYQRTSELGKIIGWGILGLLLLPTIFVPMVAWRHIKIARHQRRVLREAIEHLSDSP
ncbi:MAG TPA: hypothetical protein VJH22_07650 [Candidatus Nanoarchaeia archaeon]|nr:hypothetical protein [Candidatus Nanoarchaeia archaeon]